MHSHSAGGERASAYPVLFLLAEKANEMKAMAEQGLNIAKDKCKVS
jgi:hypothetical protein